MVVAFFLPCRRRPRGGVGDDDDVVVVVVVVVVVLQREHERKSFLVLRTIAVGGVGVVAPCYVLDVAMSMLHDS